MKRISFFALASSIVLVVVGVFSSKANKKFTTITVDYYNPVAKVYSPLFTGASQIIFLTSGAHGASTTPATFVTGTTTHDLYTSGSTHKQLFLPTSGL